MATPPSTNRRGQVLTFYSYKGGTGRSMALANFAWILAGAGRRVLMIDWDLEAPGLHRYFRPFLIDEELSSSEGLIDLVENYANQAIKPVDPGTPPPDPAWYLKYADFSDYVLSVNFPHFPEGGKIDLLPAGRQSDRYALTVNSFNWQNFYDRLGGGGFFEAVRSIARERYDYVLIDSRTGVSDTSGICSVQMPDTLVVCFTYNNQGVKGAAAVARSAVKERAKLVEKRLEQRGASSANGGGSVGGSLIMEDTPAPFRVFPVPMRVDSGESERLAVRQTFARHAFADIVTHVAPSALDGYWSAVEVPYTVFYAYEEILAPFKDEARDPKTVLAAFVRLASYLTDGAVKDYRLSLAPELRHRFSEAFAQTPLNAKGAKTAAPQSEESPDAAAVRKADAALGRLTDEERTHARAVLSRLVRLGRAEEGGGYFPIRAAVGDFNDQQTAVVAKLANAGVVTVSRDARQSQSDPAAVLQVVTLALSEQALRTWGALIAWLDEDREFLIWRQRLRGYASDWERSGRDDHALLSGRLLAEADSWELKRAADLNASETAYIATSKRAPTTQAARVGGVPASASVPAGAPSEGRPKGRRWIVLAGVGVLVLAAGVFLIKGGPGAVLPLDKTLRADSIVASAKQSAAAGDTAHALDLLDQAIRFSPEFVPAHLEKVRTLAQLGDLDAAKQALKTVPFAAAPEDRTALWNFIAARETGTVSAPPRRKTAGQDRAPPPPEPAVDSMPPEQPGDSPAGRAALRAAISELAAGRSEDAKYWEKRAKVFRAASGQKEQPELWSSSFVYWCFQQENPGLLPRTAAAMPLVREADKRGWFHKAGDGFVPRPGDIVVIRVKDKIFHVGITHHVSAGKIVDIGTRWISKSGMRVTDNEHALADEMLFGFVEIPPPHGPLPSEPPRAQRPVDKKASASPFSDL